MAPAGIPARAGALLLGSALAMAALWTSGCATAQKPMTASTEASRNDLLLDPASLRAAEARAHLGAAHLADKRQDHRAALDEFAAAAALDPAYLTLQRQVAAVYQKLGEWDKATNVLERAVAAHPDALDLWQQLAEVYYRTEKIDKAAAAIRSGVKAATRTNTNIAKHWLALGRTAALPLPDKSKPKGLLAPPEARVALERAAKLDPHDPDVALALGNLYAQTREFSKAVAEWLKLGSFSAEIEPRIQGLILGGLETLNAADRKTVIATLEDAIKKQPLPARLFNVLGALREMAEDFPGAAAAYRQSLALDDRQFEIHRELATAYARGKNPTEALGAVARAKEVFPEDARVFWIEGMVQAELKNYPAAVAAYTAAERLDEKEAKLNRGLFYFQYGAACERAGKFDDAEAQFRRAITIATTAGNERLLAQSYNYLGYMWADANQRLPEALEMIQKALAVEPDNAAYLDSLGWAYFRLGRFEEALKELKRAAKLMTEEAAAQKKKLTADDAVIFDHIAQTHHKLGQLDDAIKQWQRALALDPQNKDFALRLHQAQAAKKSTGASPPKQPAP